MLRNCFLLLLLGFRCMAQTGPAGVGSVANNCFWLKANAGTSSSTNNTPISSWNDQSGNAYNVSQTVTAQQPSFATNVMNGFPAIQFDNVNASNSNDKMIGPDGAQLDNTNGYTFFMVTRPQSLDGSARAVVSKRTSVSIDQSFMQFYYTSNNFYTDIQSTNDRYNTTMALSNNTNYIIDQWYDGSQTSTSRCRTYVSGSLNVTAAESSSTVPDNSSPLIIGSTDASDSRPFGGYIAEIIIYRQALNDAARTIVDNYLSAKYNISLLTGDKYVGDNSANGDMDYDVAGVGQESTGSSTSFSASISKGLSLSVNSGLDNGDYVIAGHSVTVNSDNTTDVGGITGTNVSRWERVWYVDVTNTLTAINALVEFDMSDGGSAATPSNVSNYVLLYRSGTSGSWTELTTASSIAGDRVIFSSVTFSADGYYTIGTRNFNLSPLPVTLETFTAQATNEGAMILWTTAQERNMKTYTLERSTNGVSFETIASIQPRNKWGSVYNFSDAIAIPGIYYYRLRMVEFTGESHTSSLAAIVIDAAQVIKIVPNPGLESLILSPGTESPTTILILDEKGNIVYRTKLEKLPPSYRLPILAEGSYFVSVITGGAAVNLRWINKN